MVITSLAGTISIGSDALPKLARVLRIAWGCPTSKMRTPYSSAARTLPSTSGRGALSPPMASTAIVIMGLSSGNSGQPETAGHTSGHALSKPGIKLEPLLDVVNRPAFVVTAMRTSPVGLLHFVAIRTLGHRGREQVVVSTTLVLARLGMSTFWIRHYITPGSRLIRGYTLRQSEQGRILWAFGPEIYCFLSQSCFNRARGARRGSVVCVSQRHSS